ncbi:MAG: acyltransferase [Thermosynechococcaceae cyanobacterium]
MPQEALYTATRSIPRHPVLDGWRGISILCVLAAHLLPLGPKSWQLNEMMAPLGMCLFFALSGFLITTTLIYRLNVKAFLIRRFCRILPLAWMFLLVALPLTAATPDVYWAHFLFYANFPPFWLTDLTAHFWSLCVEMQFYLWIAGLVLLLKQRGLLLLPISCLAITATRIGYGELASIVTYYRVDEILAGGCLALVCNQRLGNWLPSILGRVNPYLILGLLLLACHPASGAVNYLRPYLAVSLVGATLYQTEGHPSRWLLTPNLAYIASISYALYIIHPLAAHGWLGSGDGWVKYAKRPLVFLLSFGFAHLSTFYYEKWWINWGKQWSRPAPQ